MHASDARQFSLQNARTARGVGSVATQITERPTQEPEQFRLPVISLCTNLDELRQNTLPSVCADNYCEFRRMDFSAQLRSAYAIRFGDFARWQSRLQKINPAFRQMGFLGRRAPLATACMQPNDSVHHETIRLVSLNFRLRRRIASVVASIQIYHTNGFDFAIVDLASHDE